MASAAGVAGVRATLDLGSKSSKCVQCGEPDSARITGYASVTTYVLPARLWRGAPSYSLSNGRLPVLIRELGRRQLMAGFPDPDFGSATLNTRSPRSTRGSLDEAKAQPLRLGLRLFRRNYGTARVVIERYGCTTSVTVPEVLRLKFVSPA